MVRGLAAALLLAYAVPAASEEADASEESTSEAREIEAEMERDRARDAELGAKRVDELRERFDRNLDPSADRARENALDRQLDERLSAPDAPETDIPGCFASTDALRARPGSPLWHRRLRIRDFRGSETDGGQPASVARRATGAIELACIGRARLTSSTDGRWRAAPTRLEFLAVLLRDASRWNPQTPNPTGRLRHEQVHFDLAEVVARDTNASLREVLDLMRGEGDSPEAAAADLGRRCQTLLGRAQGDFEELRVRYDLETIHGSDAAAQSIWLRRARAGLARSSRDSRSR